MAYFALNNYNVMPWDFAELPLRRKAALIGMIKVRVEKEKRNAPQTPSGKKSGRSRR